MSRNKVLIVDGMALLFRSFYATAVSGYYRVNSKGVPTNAVHGFFRHLFLALNKFQPSHLVCCWDMGGKTFRNEIYPSYKANRGEPPLEMLPQFDLVKEAVKALDISNVGLVNYEADDCIGTLAKQYEKEADVFILTGDHDILQLMTDSIRVILLKKGHGNYQVWDTALLEQEKGITPFQFIDLKALMGDSSDNYPGVKGIGEKTALKLLKSFDSIEGILNHLDHLTPAQQKRVLNDLDLLHTCRTLATIKCDVQLDVPLNDTKYRIDQAKKRATFEELEFNDLYGILHHFTFENKHSEQDMQHIGS